MEEMLQSEYIKAAETWMKDLNDHCCLLADNIMFGLEPIKLCLNESNDQRNAAYPINIDGGKNNLGLIKCGKHVDATICPNGHQFGDVEGMRELGYSCKSDSLTVQEKGIKISSGQNLS